MVTEATRAQVWQQMLDVARFHRYYDKMAGRYQWRYNAWRIALVAVTLSGGGALSAVWSAVFESALPAPVETLAMIGVGVLLAVDMQAGYGNKAAILDSVQHECSDLERSFDSLWAEIQGGQLADEDAQRRYTVLAGQLSKMHERSRGAKVPTDDKLNKQCEASAVRVLKDRYVTQPV